MTRQKTKGPRAVPEQEKAGQPGTASGLAAFHHLALILLLGAAPLAQAQVQGERGGRFLEKAQAQVSARFAKADADGDGRLTRDEARNAMPRVYQNFDAIDGAHSGYVTLEQIREFTAAQIAERRQQQGS